MSLLYSLCRNVARQIRYPVHQSSLQLASSTFYCTPRYVSSYCRLSCQNTTVASCRLLHTAVTSYNRDRFADSEDFSDDFSGQRSNIRRKDPFADEDDFSGGYASRDNRGQRGSNQSSQFDDTDEDFRGFSSRRGEGGFGRDRGGFGGGRGGYQGRSDFGGTRRDEFHDQGRQGFDLTDFTPGSGAVDASRLPPVQKDFFEPTSQLTDRTVEENKQYLQSHQIIIKGKEVPPPIQQFTDVQFPQAFDRYLKEFQAPTPIQAQGWSAALKGSDIIGIGQTGSGKTLGYLLPALMHISHHKKAFQEQGVNLSNAPIGLVLAPTRELVQQIITVADQYGPSIGVHAVAMYGGSSRNYQLSKLNRNCQLVVGTPGRLLDFIQSGELTFGHCSFLVLDEADRMLDMGFEPQIRNIIRGTRRERQTLMWSATWPEEVKGLASEFLTNPVHMCVGSTELRANPDITQNVHVCDSHEKIDMLLDLLKEMFAVKSDSQALIFVETKRTADRIARHLGQQRIRAEAIHGDKTQRARDFVLDAFRRGRCPVLVATDVAARGLDIPDLMCVVNYDFPNDTENYVHRIGRTGRRGNKGIAHTFFTMEDAGNARSLIKVLKDAGQTVDEQLTSLANMGGSSKKRGFGGGQRRGGGRGGGYNNRHDYGNDRW